MVQTLLYKEFNHLPFVTQETWVMLLELPLPSSVLPCKNLFACLPLFLHFWDGDQDIFMKQSPAQGSVYNF